MRGGLAWLDTECHARFGSDVRGGDRRAAQRQVLDDIAWPKQAKPEFAARRRRSSTAFRDLTATGFFSSEMGVEDLQYIGNVFDPDWNGCPRAAAARSSASATTDETRSPAHGTSVDDSASASSAAASTPASTCRRWQRRARRRRARRLEPQREERRRGRGARARSSTSARRRPYASITDMVADPAIDAIWLCGPNQARIENVEEIVRRRSSAARATLHGHRLREAAGAQRRRGEAGAGAGEARRAQARLSREPALRAAGRSAAATLLWARGAAHHRPARTSRAPPRSTAGRTCPGSGRASCRAAACSTT